MPSGEVLKAQLWELLNDTEKPDSLPVYFALGNNEENTFRVSDAHPNSAADFTDNQGLVIITGPNGAMFSDIGRLSELPMSLSCWAVQQSDAGYLGEHCHERLRQWGSHDARAKYGQCIQSINSFNYSGPNKSRDSGLFFSSLNFTVILSS